MSNWLVPVLDNFQWQKPVISILNTPPGETPIKGNRYLIGTSPTGAWSTKANNITYYSGSEWIFIAPSDGFVCFVIDKNKHYAYYSTIWHPDIDQNKKEYHGIVAAGALSFDNSSHILTIASGTNSYYCLGDFYTTASAITCDLDSYITLTANTLYYIYFDDDSGTLKASTSFWNLKLKVPVATVFWNGTSGTLNKETHNYTRDIDWHINAHLTIGTRYYSGLTLTKPNITDDALLQIETGDIYDEDIVVTTGQQTVCRIFYKISASVFTFVDSSLPYAGTSGYPQYLDTDTYTLTNVDSSKYVCMWVYATTDILKPIYIIPTHAASEHNTLANARAEVAPNLASLNINPEMKLIYKFIYKGDGNFQESIDYRNSSSLPAGGTASTTAGAVAFTPYGNIGATAVQTAIQELDDEKIATTALDNDPTLAANSSTKIATQQATKAYVDILGIGTNTIRDLTLNIMLNAFRIAQQGALTLLKMVDGFIDEYEDESGVDTTNSTNESYNSTDDYYSPTSESIDSYTKLLLHLDNNVTDSATGKTVTNNGVTFSSSTKKFGSHSGLFNASSGYLSLADSADWAFSTGDFTIDCWIYMTGTYNYILYSGEDFGHNYIYFYVGNGTIEFAWCNTSESGLRWTFAKNLNQWYHVSVVRHNTNDWHLFIDGVEATLTSTWGTPYSASLPDLTTALNIGYAYGIYGGFTGYIDEFRISKGIARCPADSYTKLLLNGDGLNESLNIVDSEETAKTLTLYGDTQLSTEQKKFTGSSIFFGQQDAYTKLLLHLNNNVTDAATGKSVTNNSVTFSTSVKKFGTHSGYFSGTNAYLSLADADDWDFGTGDFTIEWWMYPSTIPESSGYCIAGNCNGGDSSKYNGWRIMFGATQINFVAMFNGASYAINFAVTHGMTANNWYHWALVRSGTTITYYCNGTECGRTTDSGPTNITGSTKALVIGTDIDYDYDYPGYIDEFRISKGIARNNFLFDSANSKTPTNNGVSTSSSIKKIGTDSAYFNGTSNYLTYADCDDWYFNTDLFTIDCWVYFSSINNDFREIWGQRDDTNGRNILYVQNQSLEWDIVQSGYSTMTISGAHSLSANTWYHIACIRGWGGNANTFAITIDGVLFGSQTVSIPVTNKTGTFTIGRDDGSGGWGYWAGYIDEFRVSRGIARWTTGFTPSTSAYTADSYDKLLLHFDNSFTAQTFPYGALSYATIPDSDDFNFGTGAFTIDMWIRFTTIDSNNQWFIGPYTDNSNHSRFGYVPALGLYFNAYSSASTVINFTCPWTPVVNTWYHIAVVRISATDATTHRLYIDGIAQTLTLQAGAWTGTMPDFSGSLYIGRFGTNTEYLNAYVDSLRISKGIARWTSNFTPPTASYLDFTPPTVQYGAVLNMTLLSNAQTAESVPTSGRIILFEEDVDSITLNTDIKAYLSRDNGTTYTQVTLEDCGNYVSGAQILQGEVSISGQPSGSNMKYKVETLNNKNLKLHGTAVSWK